MDGLQQAALADAGQRKAGLVKRLGALGGGADAHRRSVSANLKLTTFVNASRRKRQCAFGDPANVLSPTVLTELCSDRVSDPGETGYGAKRNGRAECLQGVRCVSSIWLEQKEHWKLNSLDHLERARFLSG